MKNKIKKIIFIMSILFALSMEAQVTVSIYDVVVNTTSLSAGTPVDIGNAPNRIVKFKLNVTKPSNLSLGNCTVIIETYKSNGDHTLQFPVEVNNYAVNTTGSIKSYEFELFEDDLDFINNNYLVATVEQTISPFLRFESNHVQLKKSPTYNYQQSLTNIDCGSITPITFSASSNAPLNVTYQWNYAGGWLLTGGTLNSPAITLKQTNSNLSDIYVTPIFNGVAQPYKIFKVDRNIFSSSATLSGNSIICPGNNGVYTISGLGAGNTVTWSTSKTAIATVSGGTQSQVTVNGLSNGTVDLIATITNACGQTVTKTKTITIGAPVLSGNIVQGELWIRKSFFPQTLTFPAVQGATSYNWVLTPDTIDFPPVCPTTGAAPAKFNNNLLTITTTTPSATASFGNCLGHYTVTCTVSNICGSTIAYQLYVTVGNSGGSPCFVKNSLSKSYTIVQNPIKNGDIKIRKNNTIQIEEAELGDDIPTSNIVDGDSPCYIAWPKVYNGLKMNNNQPKNSNSQVEVKIFDFFGKQVYTNTIDASKEEISIKDSNLTSGKYLLHINDGINTQKEIIIIE